MIPKKIHFCWLSGDPYPELIAYCVESWKKYLPDYEIVLWDQAKFDINSVPWVRQAFEQRKYAFAADYIRLYALYTEGGIYLDSDVEVLKSFNDLLENDSFMGLERSGDFEPAVVGAKAGNKWIGKCLEYYTNRQFIKTDGSVDAKPLPVIVGETLKTVYSVEPVTGFCEQLNLQVYACEYFSPKSFHTKNVKTTPNTYSIHHFDGKWIRDGLVCKLKNVAHRVAIFALGEGGHNKFIRKIRK